MAAGEQDKPAITDSARAEFSDFIVAVDRAGAWNATVVAFGEYLAPDPWEEIATRIEQCVAEGQPASFIRLGDGEGNLLALGLDGYPALVEYCARAISLRKFGAPEVLLRAAPEILPRFHAALRNAALIGFPRPFLPTQLGAARTEADVRPIQGVVSVHRYLSGHAADLALGSKTGAPAGFHRGLLPHYESLISGRRIGIVTCRPELAAGLRERMGARAVDLRVVPTQALMPLRPGTPVETGHWPDRFRELSEELRRVDSGRLWLVAAGILGKIYCDVIRGAGGIALDIGHTADVWAGVRSRLWTTRPAIDRWRIA